MVIVLRVTDSSDNGRPPALVAVKRCAPAAHHSTTAAAVRVKAPGVDSATGEYVRELVATAPPLIPEQLYRLRGLILHAKAADKTSSPSCKTV